MAARNALTRHGPPEIADDAQSEWLDEMVKKLFKTLEDQLERVAGARSDAGGGARTAQGRAADARTLATLERTLERLARLERERTQAREKKVAKHDTSARATLERRLDKLLAAATAKTLPGKPERG